MLHLVEHTNSLRTTRTLESLIGCTSLTTLYTWVHLVFKVHQQAPQLHTSGCSAYMPPGVTIHEVPQSVSQVRHARSRSRWAAHRSGVALSRARAWSKESSAERDETATNEGDLMRHNGRAPLMASRMRPEHLNLRDGEPRMAVCPDCLRWRRLQRSVITPHRADATPSPGRPRRYHGDKPAGGPRCPGSAQRITIDISIEQWGERLLAADSTATGRHSARQHYMPLPQPQAPVHRLADRGPRAERALPRLVPFLEQARRAVIEHRTGCPACQAGGRCATGRDLEIRLRETQATCTIAREQQDRADRIAGERAHTARQERARARQESLRQVLPAVDRADRHRHNIAVPTGSGTRTLADDHERIRRAVSWPAPAHGGPDLPHEHLTI